MTEAKAVRYDPIAVSAESTVVAEFVSDSKTAAEYQSEAQLEREFIKILQSQEYEYLNITTEQDLIANLRTQLEALNCMKFSDTEWDQFFKQRIAGESEGIVEKTVRIQEDYVQLLKREDGSTKNIIVNFRGELIMEPIRDAIWRRNNLIHKDGRFIV